MRASDRSLDGVPVAPQIWINASDRGEQVCRGSQIDEATAMAGTGGAPAACAGSTLLLAFPRA